VHALLAAGTGCAPENPPFVQTGENLWDRPSLPRERAGIVGRSLNDSYCREREPSREPSLAPRIPKASEEAGE